MKDEDIEEFSLRVKGNIRDLLAFKNVLSSRKKIIQKSSSKPISDDPIKQLANSLHPNRLNLAIKEIREETKSTKTFKLIPAPGSERIELPYFRAGQYLSLKVDVNGIAITRPYSLSSTPSDALLGFYELTIKKEQHGFLTNYIWENWRVGTIIESSGPEGFFYYEPLRDSRYIVGIAGGSGITPFRSMAKFIADGEINANLTILYGSSDEEDIIFYDELKKLEKQNPEKIKIVHILSCEEVHMTGCEQGFITSEIIEKYCDVNRSTFFISGPQIMYDFVKKELDKFNLPIKRLRRETYGQIKDIVNYTGFPKELVDKSFKIKVHIGNLTKEIPALSTESILVAMERAGLNPPSSCRSGECGFCRSLLISGDIYISPIGDFRRSADKNLNFIHPCSSFPISDLEINVPRSK